MHLANLSCFPVLVQSLAVRHSGKTCRQSSTKMPIVALQKWFENAASSLDLFAGLNDLINLNFVNLTKL